MNVYAEVLPPYLGQVMHRINRAIKRYAPPEVTFVDSPTRADLQILDAIGGKFTQEALRCRQYVLLMHTWKTAGMTPGWWVEHFKRSVLTVSFHNLPAYLGRDDFPFHRMPWGVDGEMFRIMDGQNGEYRPYTVMTTGYDDGQEAIRECWEASGMNAIHLNRRFDWMPETAKVINGIPDAMLSYWYNRCRYVSGLRRIEGFELPVLEGLACGARPICFDRPHYVEWFKDFAIFVPEVDGEPLVEMLRYLFKGFAPVSEAERQRVLAQFDWSNLMPAFWREVMEMMDVYTAARAL